MILFICKLANGKFVELGVKPTDADGKAVEPFVYEGTTYLEGRST